MVASAAALPSDLAPVSAPSAMGLGLSEGRKLTIFLVMSVGMFMALLDVQIVAASMAPIQAGLNAAADEIDWLQTAYLMSEIVMIPLSAYLAQALSSRWLFVASAGLFTFSSLLCGLAWDLPSMAVFRAIQGFVGGAMIPLVFTAGFSFFTGPRRAMATAIVGVISTLAPTLGPSVGGWITDTLSWRWLFFINLGPGLCVTLALIWLGRVDKATPSLLGHIDWLHAASLAVFLGGAQYVLDEGPRHQWFQDTTIAGVAWVALVAGVVFFERCLFSPRPLVRLGTFKRRGFLPASLLSFCIGFGIYTIVYLSPLFLARVRGFSSLDVGGTLWVAGAAMTVAAPLAAGLALRVDQRIVMTIGLLLYALSFWMISHVTKEWGYWEMFATQVVRGAAVLFCIVPSTGMALNNVPDDQLRDASGMVNLMRNLGGTLGIALVNTWLMDYFALHYARLSEALGSAPQKAQEAIAGLGQQLAQILPDASRAGATAQTALGQMVGLEALTEAFADVFRLIAYLFIIALLLVPFCQGGTMNTDQPQH
jgi:DHA2 family multidrug resistance protein